MAALPKAPLGFRHLRPQDALWLALFFALGWLSPLRTTAEVFFLTLMAILQLAESRAAWFSGTRGSIAACLLKLLLGYLLIGYTGGINSSYYLILLFPVVSAATSLNWFGTLVFVVLACGADLSFLLFVDWSRYILLPEQERELLLRLVFLALAGYLTFTLASENRVAARNYQAAAEQLAAANESLRQAEAAVRRSERLAALGQLTAGLAHELRNPLGTIRASAEMLGKTLPPGDDVTRELSSFIASEVDRANSLIGRFLEFARPLRLRPAVSDLTAVLDRAVAALEQQKLPVSVFKNYSPDIRPFSFDAELVERAVHNLLLNAAQASPPDSSITVKTRLLDGDVEISVIDRGTGIDPKHLESIFNPFFTTKRDGVGLGLAIVSKIVDEHGGHIFVESEPSKGTAVRVLLPLRRESPAETS